MYIYMYIHARGTFPLSVLWTTAAFLNSDPFSSSFGYALSFFFFFLLRSDVAKGTSVVTSKPDGGPLRSFAHSGFVMMHLTAKRNICM